MVSSVNEYCKGMARVGAMSNIPIRLGLTALAGTDIPLSPKSSPMSTVTSLILSHPLTITTCLLPKYKEYTDPYCLLKSLNWFSPSSLSLRDRAFPKKGIAGGPVGISYFFLWLRFDMSNPIANVNANRTMLVKFSLTNSANAIFDTYSNPAM